MEREIPKGGKGGEGKAWRGGSCAPVSALQEWPAQDLHLSQEVPTEAETQASPHEVCKVRVCPGQGRTLGPSQAPVVPRKAPAPFPRRQDSPVHGRPPSPSLKKSP